MSNIEDLLGSLSNEQKQKLIEILLGGDQKPTSNQQNRPSSVDENFIVQKADNVNKKRREPVKGRENRWKDEGEFKDIKTPEFEKTPRRRDPPKKIDIECHICGKVFKQDARYTYGEFPRCNRCTGR